MFKEYSDKFPPYETVKVSPARARADKAAVFALIEKEGTMKRHFRPKPLIIAAAAVITTLLLGVGANALTQGAVIKFFIGGEEVAGELNDYVDENGVRNITFEATISADENNFAFIFNVDAPESEKARIITDENDPEFMERLRRYKTETALVPNGSEPPMPEEFGLILKESEVCEYKLENDGGFIGGEFMYSGDAYGEQSDSSLKIAYDEGNGTKTYRYTFRYYTGEEG